MERPTSFPFRWGDLARVTAARMRHDGQYLRPAALFFARSLHGLLLHASWQLDDALYSDWLEAEYEGPIFIVGHWRTGTTFLHRSLVEDVLPHAVAMNFGETRLPSITLRRTIETLSRAPGMQTDTAREFFEWLDDKRFEDLDPVHRIRLREIAEDSHVLVPMFATVMWTQVGPPSVESESLREIVFPDKRPSDEQLETLRAYRACLAKNAWLADDPSPIVVAKNPEFSKQIPLLREVFPDAKFVCLARNPIDTIPSLLEMIENIWKFTSPTASFDDDHGTLLQSGHARALLDESAKVLRKSERDLEDVPEGDKFVRKFDEFVADTPDYVEELVDTLGLERAKPDFRERVRERSERVQEERDRDRATLADYGLDEGDIVDAVPEYFERWGFETGD